MGLYGWTNPNQAKRYTDAADRIKLAGNAIAKLRKAV